MIVFTRAESRAEETYFIFRNDGSEAEVVFKECFIVKEKPLLTEEEREFFKSGKHKNKSYG